MTQYVQVKVTDLDGFVVAGLAHHKQVIEDLIENELRSTNTFNRESTKLNLTAYYRDLENIKAVLRYYSAPTNV